MLTMKSSTHFHFYHSYESLYSLLQASFYRIFFFIVCHTSSIFSILISLTINATTDNDYQLNHLFIYSLLQCYYCYLLYPLHVYSTYSAGYTTTWFWSYEIDLFYFAQITLLFVLFNMRKWWKWHTLTRICQQNQVIWFDNLEVNHFHNLEVNVSYHVIVCSASGFNNRAFVDIQLNNAV